MALTMLGVTIEEQQRLAALYDPDQELWRVPVTHFTPWDANWGIWPPDDMEPPYMSLAAILDKAWADACQQSGSIINCENQSLGEEIGLAGTSLSLHYESQRAFGRDSERTVVLPLSAGPLPASCMRIHTRFSIAGRRFEHSYPCAADQEVTFTWDGNDAWGRQLQGSQALSIRLGYEYAASYAQVSSFGGWPTSGEVSATRGGRSFTVWTSGVAQIGGSILTPSNSIGGWSLDAHHHVDAASATLYRGDGSNVSFAKGGRIDELFTTPAYYPYPDALATSPEGGIYYVDAGVIRRRDINGTDNPVAGVGHIGHGGGGHGGPAASAMLGEVKDIAVGPGGILYVAAQTLLWRIEPGGDARVIAVSFTGANPNQPPNAPEVLLALERVAVGPDGTVVVMESGRLASVSPAGLVVQLGSPLGLTAGGLTDVEFMGSYLVVGAGGGIFRATSGGYTRIAGSLTAGQSVTGDGLPATAAGVGLPRQLTYARDGSLYFVDGHTSVIRRIRGDIMERVAGIDGQPGSDGDGGDPLAATVSVTAMTATRTGGLVIHQSTGVSGSNHLFRRINYYEDVEVVPSEDGELAYVLDPDSRRHSSTIDAVTGAPILTFGYDAAGHLSSVADDFQNVVTIQRDGAGRPTAIVGPHGHRTELTVDGAGYLQTVANPEQETITLSHAPNGLLQSMVDAKGYAHSYDYDLRGRLAEDDDPVGFKSLTRIGRALDSTVHVTTQLGVKTTYEARSLQGAQAATCPAPYLGSCIERRITRPDGGVTLMRASPNGQSTIWMPDGTRIDAREGPDPRFGSSVSATKTMTVHTPGLPSVTSTYESIVELYDPEDPIGVRRLTDRSTIAGSTSETVWDGDARTLTSSSPEGRTFVEWFDARGQVVRSETPGIFPVEYFYEARGRIDHVTQGDRHTSYTYHPQTGALASVSVRTSGSGPGATYLTSSQTVDAAERILTATGPDGAVTATTYDDNGNLHTYTPPGQPAHTFGHGAGDLLASYTPPLLLDGEPRSEEYIHDSDGRPYKTVLPDGREVVFDYEHGTGRLRSVSLSDWGTISTTYDAASRVDALVRSDPASGTTTMGYTYEGPDVVSTTMTRADIAGTVAYDRSQYFSQRRTIETVNGGHPITYAYDRDQLLVSAGAMTLVNDPSNGARSSRTVGNVSGGASYNAYGDTVAVTATLAGAPLLSRGYTYDALGRISTVTESAAGAPGVTRGYRYDVGGRLEAVTDAAGVPLASYTYDTNGNRTSAPGVPLGDIVVDQHDQLWAYGARTFTYTLNGEVASVTDGTDTTEYTWDTLGALRRVELQSGRTIEYLVDPANHRIGKRVDGSLFYGLLYNGAGRPIAELDGAGAVWSRFVYSSPVGAPEYMELGGRIYVFITDQVGSVRLVLDASTGTIAQRIDYNEFGLVLQDTAPGFQPFGYAGGLYDYETGLVQFGAREYDARIGRWLSRDPLGLADGGNVYAYVGSDPVNRVDPTGTMGGFLQSATNFSAGMGDSATEGVTQKARQRLGIDDVVDKCSGWYIAGTIAGDLLQSYLPGAALGRAMGVGARALTRCRNSFAAGTLVHTPDGMAPIESLAPGDLVVARDDQTGKVAYQPIQHVIVTANKQASDLRLEHRGMDEKIGQVPFFV